jgi:Flp pilus assembly protein TadD
MPPEQARGETDRLGARSDVFGLGAILCEILSGRRPFSGNDAWQQASRGDLQAAFARLDELSVDRELVDLCQRCLSPEPSGRPSDGSAVAEAIRRWSATVQTRLEQEKAERTAAETRAVEEAKRAAVERSRRRVLLALAAALLLLVTGGGAAAWWYTQDSITKQTEARIRSENAAVEIDNLLTSSAELRERFDFATAATLLGQAEERAAALLQPEELAARIAQAERDLAIVQELDAIRLRKSTWTSDGFERKFANGDSGAYAKAFREYGIDVTGVDAEEIVGERIAKSGVSEVLLGALDDWAFHDSVLRTRLFSVARVADRNSLRRLLYEPGVEREALLELARNADVDTLAPPTIVIFARRLRAVDEFRASMDLLTRAALSHPNDYWLQFESGVPDDRQVGRVDEAIGYCRAAIAIRPHNVATYNNLGGLLIVTGRAEEAEATFREAIAVEPKHAGAHINLGKVLAESGRAEEAEVEFRRAIALDQSIALAHTNLGILLAMTGRPEEAEAEYHRAIALDANEALTHYNFGNLLSKMGRLEQAEVEFRRAVALDQSYALAHIILGKLLAETGRPGEAEAEYRQAIALDQSIALAHRNLGILLAETGRPDEAEAEYRQAIALDANYALAHNALGNLLAETDRPKEAEAEYRQAIALDANDALAHYNLGNLLCEMGRPEEAEAEYRRAIALDANDAPAYYNLGILLAKTGRPEEAEAEYRQAIALDPNHAAAHSSLGLLLMRHTDLFAEAVALLERGHELGTARGNWQYPSAQWIAEAKQFLALDQKLAGLGSGVAEPADPTEAMALADFALVRKNRSLLAARLFAMHIADASLDESLRYHYAYNAACAAARVAADDVEENAPELSDEESAAWRMRARDWLHIHLTMSQRLLTGDNEQARQAALQQLSHSLQDPDLATLRDAAIDQLPAAEQAAWRQYWVEVQNAIQATPSQQP